MKIKKDFDERRKFRRFKARKGAFAVLRPDYNILGQIKDISKGGLAFIYNAYRGNPGGFLEADLFFIENNFYLNKLPVKTVVGFKIEDQAALSSLPIHQLSMQFGKMNYYQKILLYLFIKKYTIRK